MSYPKYDANCYLCPGNKRSSGKENPAYDQIFVFDNDHPSVVIEPPEIEKPLSDLYSARPAYGVSRVVCYSPRHDLTLSELSVDANEELMHVWQEQYRDLAARPGIEHVLFLRTRAWRSAYPTRTRIVRSMQTISFSKRSKTRLA